MSPRRGTAGGGAERKGQQCRPSRGLEHAGLGALSHRADQDACPEGADRGDVTRGKQRHEDHWAGSRSGYQETEADKRSLAKERGRRQCSPVRVRLYGYAWQRPQYAEE